MASTTMPFAMAPFRISALDLCPMEDRHNVALALGGAALGAAMAVGGLLFTFWEAHPQDAAAWWFGRLEGAGVVLAVAGVYLMVAVPLLGAPFPGPRSKPIWCGTWSRMPFSSRSRARRAEARCRQADNGLRGRIEMEVDRAGFDAPWAARTAYEAIVDPLDFRTFWVQPIGVRRLNQLGFGASGPLTDVEGSTLSDPDVTEAMRKFDELLAAASEWPEFKERSRLRAKL